MDGVSRLHAVVAVKQAKEVVEFVVQDDEVVERRIVAAGVSPGSLDATFDDSGRMHALVDTEHLVFDGGQWSRSTPPPWIAAGVEAREAKFVPGAPRLTWSFQVTGKAVGAPSRVDWYGMGGAMGGVVWPWIGHGERAVLVTTGPAGDGPWVVVDPDSKDDTAIDAAAADRAGNVQLLYSRSRPGLGAKPLPAREYATVSASELAGNANAPGAPQFVQGTRSDGRALPLVPLREGYSWTASADTPGPEFPLVSIDPLSGTALVGLRWLVRHRVWGPPLEWPGHASYARTAAAGSDTFHALFVGDAINSWVGNEYPVRYARLVGNVWSSAVELGTAEKATLLSSIPDGLAIAADDKVAYAVWPTASGIVARRVAVLH